MHKTSFHFGGALAAALALLAGVPDAKAQETIADCTAIEDDAERLECFDRLARAERAVPETPAPAPAPPSEPSPTVAPTTQPSPSGPAPREPAEPASPATEAPAPEAPPRAAAETPPENFGLERKREVKGPDRIVAGVVGGFRGWGGYEKTVFELDNGQVWEQIDTRRFRYSGRDRRVEIRRASFGSFLLSPEGLNRTVRVRRVK